MSRGVECNACAQAYGPVPVHERMVMTKMAETKLNRILIGDCRRMKAVPDNSVHLVVTSPPYNQDIPYANYKDKIPEDEYMAFTRAWIHECWRVLVSGGRIAVNVGNMGRKPYRFLSDLIVRELESMPGALARGEIIWFKGWSMAAGGTAWGSWCNASNPVTRDCHEYVIVFSKDTYKLDCTGFEKDIKDGTAFARNTLSVWLVPPETCREHPAPFPVELAKRIIQLYTRPGMTILDPFMGSGTTGVACVILARPRKFIGYELDGIYARAAINRIKRYQNHKLEEYVTIKESAIQRHRVSPRTLDAFV